MDNQTSWKFKDNLYVNSFINDVFDENKFLYGIVFQSEYDILKNDTPQNPNNTGRFMEGLEGYFDHYYAVSFKENVSLIDEPESITGIMNFPYIQWDTIDEFINNIPKGWTAFVINPILMRYAEGSVGLFLTPKYLNNAFIEECNDFTRLKTGYPLFLEYANTENVAEIHYNKPELTLESYVEEMKKYGKNKGLSKLLDFWADNDNVKVASFEYSFKDYMDNLPFSVWRDINFKEIKSITQFELIHEETGETLGPFHKFALDKSFKLADTDEGVLKLTDQQINDLIEGKYDFKLIE
jgi:hypothetical protein